MSLAAFQRREAAAAAAAIEAANDEEHIAKAIQQEQIAERKRKHRHFMKRYVKMWSAQSTTCSPRWQCVHRELLECFCHFM